MKDICHYPLNILKMCNTKSETLGKQCTSGDNDVSV